MTKALIFDLGGVLVDLDLQNCKRHFKEVLGFQRITEILDPCHQKGIYSDLEEGLLSEEEFKSIILSESALGSTPAQVDECMWSLLVNMDAYKVPYLNELSSKYDLYILSNNNPISMRRCHEVFAQTGLDYEKVFKKEFISYQMKLLKPGKEIFTETIRQIGCAPEEALFIDDSPANVEGARNAGVPSLLYKQGSDLTVSLNRRLADAEVC